MPIGPKNSVVAQPEPLKMTDAFARDGFIGPVRVFREQQCLALANYLVRTDNAFHPVWNKGRATSDGVLADIATHPVVQRLLTPILGENIILWGASAVRRPALKAHPWHADAETSKPGRFVSLWVGLRNVTPQSSLRVIAGSHRVSKVLQQFQDEAGLKRGSCTDEQAVEWAQSEVPEARLIEIPAHNGDAVLFDGKLWHGSRNLLMSGARHALLLQYASADTKVRIPSPGASDWPVDFLDEPRPPVIQVTGQTNPDLNRVVSAPKPVPSKAVTAVSSLIRDLADPDADGPERPWRPTPIFRGRTPALDFLSCHAATLLPGHSPHSPHAHQDEELLFVVDGSADLLIATGPDYATAKPTRVTAGDFAFYPAFQHHTIHNPTDRPVRYLMFRWNRGQTKPLSRELQTSVIHQPQAAERSAGRGFATRTIFEGQSQWLRKLHCHTSRVEPGAGYAEHADAYDVAMIVQSGRVETLGRSVGPGELIFYPARSLHGLRSIGTDPAFYTVFEFHGAPLGRSARAAPALAQAKDRALA